MTQPPLQWFGERWLGELLIAATRATAGTDDQRLGWASDLLGRPVLEADTGDGRESLWGEPKLKQPGEPTITLQLQRARTKLRGNVPYAISSEKREQRTSDGDPTWYRTAEPLPPVGDAVLGVLPTREPLFAPAHTRALLSAGLATPRGVGEIDLERLLDRICRKQPIETLPRVRRPTLRLGLQLLLDFGEGMQPFARDRGHLTERILDVVGRDRVEVRRFARSPLRGSGPKGRRTWKRGYMPPAPGTPVVVVTDLGLVGQRLPGDGASPEEWASFARRVRARDCPLLALTPYAEERWPALVRRHMQIIHWDRATTVSGIRKTIGRGLEVSPT